VHHSHIWLSRIDKLRCPDQLGFDLDPSSEDFEAVKATARSFRQLLDELELPAYVKTTGSRGLHVAVPLDRGEDIDAVRAFARRLEEIVVMEDPENWTSGPAQKQTRWTAFRGYQPQRICPDSSPSLCRSCSPRRAHLDDSELEAK
jgi:bifunctional non-homologous end joining protein LigD